MGVYELKNLQLKFNKNLVNQLNKNLSVLRKQIFESILLRKSLDLLSGFLFGSAVSLGLGFTQINSVIVGILTGFGVVFSGSFVAYLTIQFLAVAFLTLLLYIFIRTSPLVIPPEVLQFVLIAVLFLSPLLTRSNRIRTPLLKLSLSKPIELFVALLFSFLVQVLRGRMPADAPYAFTQMYGNEDNAGIIDVLSHSIHFGVSSNVSALGEFTNSIYISAAGFTSWFGDPSNQALISPLTHWNMILLFMAWAPIAALVLLAFSGKRPKRLVSVVAVAFMTSMFGLVLWPFTSIGHTAVISSGMFAAALMAITLNERFRNEHPFVFAMLLTALGFVAGNIWFPLFPFTAAVVGVAFLFLLRSEYKKNNKPLVFGLIGFFAVVAYNLLPALVNLVSQNESLLQLQGGTRAASESLILIWLLLSSLAVWAVTKKSSVAITKDSNLFLVAVAALIASNAYLFLTGILNNAGAPGYGASKYLLTSIAFSTPLLWMMISLSRKKINPLRVLAGGLALVFAILVAQPDSQPVATSFMADSQQVNTEASQTGVFAAIQEALDKDADHILCVADYGFPMEDGLTAFDAYLCTRWGQAVAVNKLDAPTSQWSFAFLNRNDFSSNEWVRDTYADENVIVIRFPDPSNPLLVSETWWRQYVHPSWEIVTVK
jgi:hypothetical protein